MKTLLERFILTEKIPPVPVHDCHMFKEPLKAVDVNRDLLILLSLSGNWPKDCKEFHSMRDKAIKYISKNPQARDIYAYFEPRPTKIKEITISARRWFQKTYGNTYFSVKYSIDGGDWVHVTDYEYGYENQCSYAAFKHMQSKGVLPKIPTNQSPFNWCACAGVKVHENIVDVDRKKDLKFHRG